MQAVLRYLGSGRLSLQPDGSAADGRPERTPKDPKPTGAAPLAAGHAYAGRRLSVTQHDAILQTMPKVGKALAATRLCCGKLKAALEGLC